MSGLCMSADASPRQRYSSALARILALIRDTCPDINFTEFSVLITIAENEGVTVAGVAWLCGCTEATASRTIRRMAPREMPGALAPFRGLLVMMRGPTENRSRHVFLTPRGEALCRSFDLMINDPTLPALMNGRSRRSDRIRRLYTNI